MWFTVSTTLPEAGADDQIPEVLQKFGNLISVIVKLESREDYIHLNLLKDHDSAPQHDLHLKLDPQILLIADEK